ncbi:NAD(P)H-binding protein [Mycolicibacterium goodii]|uniref:NAD(P)H-binding protein n=1 Tax=Mycolicibacterium goodii TaxID=134601 RepID=A0ABS6HR81_MYCGD|nr:NAD(P)H-binding protein [Mycolicibacterium goodii]MBU8824786.1 NAD(P)H-binding protein [Mycolicibacterium goodii]MBU8828937.1 NAD(P)H-binding protein [Mycolicibacterium goodii]MBU8840286.1 NAD(P)H-binding protein [Mycolicibacterium goodii]
MADSTIAVIGAAGNIGYATSLALRKAGIPVSAILRDPSKADKLSMIGCEIGLADIRDEAALSAAITNAVAVLVILPPPPQAQDAVHEMRQITESLAEALDATRPERVVAISDYGAHLDEWIGMPSAFHLFERRLRRVEVPKVFLRSAEHMHGWTPFIPVARTTGILPSFHDPVDALFPTVAASDVGLIAAELLCSTTSSSERIVHAEGPRRYSANDVAAALGVLLGREVVARTMPRDRWQENLEHGLSPSTAALVAQVYDAHNKGGLIDIEPNVGELRRGATEFIDALRPFVVTTPSGVNGTTLQ